jgi:putative mRNA 3-end processing factor
MQAILQQRPQGLYCPQGDFFIDPRQPVKRAVITHAHADHARGGSQSYLCARESQRLLEARIGREATIQPLAYGEKLRINAVSLSLHPAGHVLGSAQVRIERGGRVCVISGDYKTDLDPTCAPLEPLRCHHFISESTFGLPIFKWPSQQDVMGDILSWWQANRKEGRTSVLFAYALGKAQRVLAGLGAPPGPILTHGAVEKINRCYREAGIALPATRYVGGVEDRALLKEALVIAPPSADHPAWLKRFPQRSRGFASGWMRIRGHRRRRAVDRGFVLSDHSDWDGLVQTITATGAESIALTHGYAHALARWLQEKGYPADILPAPDEGRTDREENRP